MPLESKARLSADKSQNEVTLSITIEVKRIDEEHISGCLQKLNEDLRKIFPTEKIVVKIIWY